MPTHDSLADQILTNVHDGYTLKYPSSPWRAEGPTHANGIVEIRNFPASEYHEGGAVPIMGAVIHVKMRDASIDERAELTRACRFGRFVQWAPAGPPRVACEFDSDIEGKMQAVVVGARKGGRLFMASLQYHRRDPRGGTYERVFDDVVESITVNAP
jgi:hypothetical protein